MKNISKIQFDMIVVINEQPEISMNELASLLYKPETTIRAQYDKLVDKGYLTVHGVTSQAREMLKKHRIKFET